MTPFAKQRHAFLTPQRATWLGIGLIVAGLAAQWLLPLGVVFQEQQNYVALNATFTAVQLLQSVALPLGIAFVAFSIVARAVIRTETLEVEDDEPTEGDGEEGEPAPRVFSSRVVLIAGTALVVIGFVLTTSLRNWTESISSDPGLAQDFLFYIAPMLEPVLLPLGILLIPCAWALRLLESRSVLSAIH